MMMMIARSARKNRAKRNGLALKGIARSHLRRAAMVTKPAKESGHVTVIGRVKGTNHVTVTNRARVIGRVKVIGRCRRRSVVKGIVRVVRVIANGHCLRVVKVNGGLRVIVGPKAKGDRRLRVLSRMRCG